MLVVQIFHVRGMWGFETLILLSSYGLILRFKLETFNLVTKMFMVSMDYLADIKKLTWAELFKWYFLKEQHV
jgi:hypothetical protein